MSSDTPESRLRNFETLYALSQYLFEEERKRFVDGERKLERFWAFLVAAAGAGTFVVRAAEVSLSTATSGWEASLLALLVVFYMAILVGLAVAVCGLRVSKFSALPVGTALPEFFRANTYVTTLYAMSKRNFEGAEKAHAVNERKMRFVFYVSNSLAVSIATGVAAVLLLSVDRLEERHMTTNIENFEAVPGGDEPEGNDSPAPEAPLPEPDTTVEAPPLDLETRAFEPDLDVEAPPLVRIEKGE